jgi:hypothetical protein
MEINTYTFSRKSKNNINVKTYPNFNFETIVIDLEKGDTKNELYMIGSDQITMYLKIKKQWGGAQLEIIKTRCPRFHIGLAYVSFLDTLDQEEKKMRRQLYNNIWLQ